MKISRACKRKDRTEQTFDIAKLKRGDHTELRIFAQAVTHWIYNLVLGYVFNKEDAEEIVQDCLVAALQGLSKFKNQSSIKTWIYRIAINKSKDLIKYKNRAKRSAQTVEVQDYSAVEYFHPGLQLESREAVQFMVEGLNALPEKQRTALTMAKFDHKSQKEIAEFMGISPKAVESLLSRAKANFKKHLQIRNNEEN